MKTQVSSTTYSVKGVSSQSASLKYNGLIKESASKKIRNALFGLFDFITVETPKFPMLHYIVSIWRILQFFGPSLCVMNYNFWAQGSALDMTTDILSITFHLFPGFIRPSVAGYYMYSYTALFVIFFIVVIGSAFYYQKRAELPKALTISISIFMSTFGYLLHPIASMFGGEILTAMIFETELYFDAFFALCFVFSLLIFIIYMLIYVTGAAVSVTFKSDSLMTIMPTNSALVMIFTIAVTILSSMAAEMPFIPRISFTVLTILIYLASLFLVFLNGGFVNFTFTKMFSATAVASALLMAIIVVYEIIGIKGSELILVIVVVVWIICYIITSFLFNRLTLKQLRILDEIEENVEKFEMIKNPLTLNNIIVTGFRNAHPLCINYSIFKLAIERWPKKLDVWLLFAKFTAIYPEETQQLSFIELNMLQNRLTGGYAKHTMSQIESIIKQREPNLIPELKSKLDQIGKHVMSCKAKIRYIWDLVLQGNTNELESIMGNANKSIRTATTEFNQLLNKFPNNRFVARAYARFVRDVVADHALHQVWSQRCALLIRGVSVFPDIAHELGILAFPNIPKTLEISQNMSQANINQMTDDTLTQEIDGDDESLAIDQELKMSIKENIRTLVIPSYRNTRLLHILSLVILFIAPVIAISISTPIYIDEITGSISYLYSLSKIRAVLFQGVGLMVRLINENIQWSYPANHPVFPGMKLFPYPSYEDTFGSSLKHNETSGPSWGGTFDTRKQLIFIESSYGNLISGLAPLKAYKVGNKAMDNVRTKIFDQTIPFTYVHDSVYLDCWTNMTLDGDCFYTKTTLDNFSMLDILTTYMTIIEDTLALKEIPWDSYNKHYAGTALNNLDDASDVVTNTVTLMLDYFSDLNNSIQKITQFSMIIIIVVITIWYIFICVFTIKTMKRDKNTIYRCLTSLQKSIVFKVAEQFRILRKEEDDENKSTHSRDEELSKQEENLLKLFTTSSDAARRKALDQVVTVTTTIIMIILHVAITVIMVTKFANAGTQLNNTAPHIEHSMASYAFDLGSVILLNMLPGSVYPSRNFNIFGFTTNKLISTIDQWQTTSLDEFFLMKYGDVEKNIPSFAALGVTTDFTSSLPDYCNLSSVPTNKHDLYNCIMPELTMSYSQMLVSRLVNIYQSTTDHVIFPGDDEDLSNIWHLHMNHVFDRYYYPLFLQMTNLVIETLKDDIPQMNQIGYIMLIIALFFELLYMFVLYQSEDAQKYALSMLLQCPGKTVLSNNHIISVLGGNFKLKIADTMTRDADFYNVVVEEMPDSIIIIKQDGTILSVNKATKRIYNFEPEELINKKIDVIGSMFKDGNPFTGIFEEMNSNVAVKDKKGFEKHLTFVNKEKEEIHVEIQFAIMQDGIFVASRDVTQSFMYDKLIADEKAKSDLLLSSILPSKMVSRVAAGEKNISFAVQSVTIVFMDIVSFTPWCGSLPAATVMKTLNILFREFDHLLSMHSTMTKIKCIGDCYMAAGGIFADVNQPAAHAKDVVEFGLDSIDAILRIDEEIKQSLRIRVGVNTGGPIVAGVLGTEKPTFEILGPTINMAQQMEHHGIPMKVHISRSVYELIYGGNFNVKERGQVELKQGSAITYLVEKSVE